MIQRIRKHVQKVYKWKTLFNRNINAICLLVRDTGKIYLYSRTYVREVKEKLQRKEIHPSSSEVYPWPFLLYPTVK